MIAGASLRRNLLWLLVPPIVAALSLGTAVAYFVSIDVATEAHDQALVDVGLALSQRLRSVEGRVVLDLPRVAEQVLRMDKFDAVHFAVQDAQGRLLGGEAELQPPPAGALAQGGVVFYDSVFRARNVRAVAFEVPCEAGMCRVSVAETTVKRERLSREILLGSLIPQVLLAAFAAGVLWIGVKQGLNPLARLSDEIKSRSPSDLRPIDETGAPDEAKPLVTAINQLFDQVQESNRNQQRFLANAAHQLRTPLAGLQAHAELALAQPVPNACKAELEYVHSAAIRTARLANQLLSLARAEPGGDHPTALSRLDLRTVVEECADEWVHRALARDIDLGFDLEPAVVAGDGFLLREVLANLVGNAVEYTPSGGRVTVRSGPGTAGRGSFLEVEDDGPGIPPAERERAVERFYRLPGTPGTGSGLGLAIVREIATGHGAQVEIGEGQEGRGCRVRLNFPPTAAI